MVDDVAEQPALTEADPAKTLPTEGDAASQKPGGGDKQQDAASQESGGGDKQQDAASQESGGGDEEQEGQWFRNRTPDRLRLRNDHGDELVFAPLEEKKLLEEKI